MQETVSLSETPKRRARRSYTKEFKARLVAECTTGDKSIAQVGDGTPDQCKSDPQVVSAAEAFEWPSHGAGCDEREYDSSD